MTRHAECIPLALLALAMTILALVPAHARENSYTDREGYAYWDIWWREQRSDDETALLLHFNRPTEHP